MAEKDDDAVPSKADVLALAAEAEAEAAEAEALAAAARAKARAARLRREALAAADDDDEYEYDESDDYEDYDEDESEEYEDDADEYEESEDYDESENYSEVEPEVAAKPSRRERMRGAVRLPGASMIAKVVAVLLILGFSGLSTYFMWEHHDATERDQKAAAFIAGAKKGVVNMTSLDFKKAKEDVQRVIDSSTGEFRDDFQQRAADFTKVVEQSKVVTEGTVNAAAIESMDGRTAQVLVSATSRVTNSAGAKDEPRAWRLRVTVTEEDGQYKMSKVEFVP